MRWLVRRNGATSSTKDNLLAWLEANPDRRIHLLMPWGGTACGVDGPSDADINYVTCRGCLDRHDTYHHSNQHGR